MLGCSGGGAWGTSVPWSASSVSPDLQRRPPPVLSLAGDAYIVPGELAVFEVLGADAGERVYLVAAHGEGDGPCHEGLGGMCLDLETPVRTVVHVFADEDGVARLHLTVPSRWTLGRDIAMQAVLVRGLGGVDTGKSGVWVSSVVESIGETGDTGDAACWSDTGVEPEPVWAGEETGVLTPGGEFPASYALLEYDHHHATLDLSASGGVMVSYDDGEPPIARVKATIFDEENAPVSDDFFVAWLGEYAPGRPDVLALGEAWLVGYSDATDVFLVHFDAAGEEIGRTEEPINVASGTTLYQGMPDLALFDDEEHILVTYAFGEDADDPQGRYYARIVDTSLTPTSEEWLLADTPIGPSPPDASKVGDHVAVVWSTRAEGCEDVGVGRVWVQRFDVEGAALDDPMRVDLGTLPNPPTRPVVQGDESGRLVVAWRSQTIDRQGSGIRMRVLGETGALLTDSLVVGAETPESANRPVLAMEGGVAAIAWEEGSEETGLDVYLNAFDLDRGLWVGEPVLVHEDVDGDQERPAIAMRTLEDENVEVVVSFEQLDEVSGQREVYVNRFFLVR